MVGGYCLPSYERPKILVKWRNSATKYTLRRHSELRSSWAVRVSVLSLRNQPVLSYACMYLGVVQKDSLNDMLSLVACQKPIQCLTHSDTDSRPIGLKMGCTTPRRDAVFHLSIDGIQTRHRRPLDIGLSDYHYRLNLKHLKVFFLKYASEKNRSLLPRTRASRAESTEVRDQRAADFRPAAADLRPEAGASLLPLFFTAPEPLLSMESFESRLLPFLFGFLSSPPSPP